MTRATILDEGQKVVLVVDGKRICDMPPEIARQMARTLLERAALADEYINANRIIMDQAIMQRAGMPFGLSRNPKIVKAARQEAQWNGDLRRHMPLKGIEPKAVVGTPIIRKQRKAA